MSAFVSIAPGAPDELTLVAGAQRLSGWQAIRVTRGAERMPSDFDILLTERFPARPSADPGVHAGEVPTQPGLYPDASSRVPVFPGDACQIFIGADLVLTGYVDGYLPGISPHGHEVRLVGRGACADLVDCSALPLQLQIDAPSLLAVAQTLATPFGIAVRSATGDDIPLLAPNGVPLVAGVTPGETPYEIIERIARYAGVLVLEQADGTLLLSHVGAARMASGFVERYNVQAANAEFRMDGRFSEYLPFLTSFAVFNDIAPGGAPAFPPVRDEGVPRYRPRAVISEQFQYDASLAQLRAEWEAARRFGRSQLVRVTADSWRDAAGALWRPNALATVHIPGLKLDMQEWIITDVTFLRDAEAGTRAEIILMPPEALTPVPSIVQYFAADISREVGAAGAPATAPAAAPTGGAQ